MKQSCFLTKKFRAGVLVLFPVLAFWAFSLDQPARAQEAPNPFPGIRPPEILPQWPEQKPPPLAPRVEPTPPLQKPPQTPGLKAFVREIRIEGNTVFSAGQLSEVTSPYLNRELTSADFESLRRALTLYYVDRGYINSGAVLPDQQLRDGTVTYRIIEGRLTDIDVEGNRWLDKSYYRDRIFLGAGPPLNINSLLERLQILQQDDRIARMRGELGPGLEPGESELKLDVRESLPFSVSMGVNNYQSSNVGEVRGFTTIADRSLTGRGDTLSFSYGGSEGSNPQIDAWYSIPITASDTSLLVRYRKNDFGVISAAFSPLNIVSRSDDYEITLRQPLYRTPSQEFALDFTGEHESDETFLLGEPFSFSPGARNGESAVTALRLAGEYTYRSQTQVLAARSRVSFGLDAFGATMNNEPSVPDGHFFSWLGQFQWARIWGDLGLQTVFRTDLQLAKDPLLIVEQIPIGGRYSVRGYPENELVMDNASISSLELRVPIVREKRWADYVQLAPFMDYGKGWDTEQTTPKPDYLWSVGIGLRWAATISREPFPVRSEFEIYWGYPLKYVSTTGNALQNEGIHFQFTLSAF